MTRHTIRTVRFSPYRKGHGPTFTLTLSETGRLDALGKWILDYRLTSQGRILFSGQDFACSPLHATDSDETVRALMGFLTLRPGDTDTEYFKDYTPKQLEFAEHHAESLAAEVDSRFGEDN